MSKRILTIVQLLLAVTAVGCGGKKKEARSPEDVAATENAGRVEPTSASERAILGSLDDLPPGSPTNVGQYAVTAGAPYFAASGARCREVAWAEERRLACRENEGWYFVPSILGATRN